MTSDPESEQLTEADTCRLFITPSLVRAGWDRSPHELAEQRYFTDGRIVLAGRAAKRRPGKRADYLLRYSRDFTLAVVEAKPYSALASDGLQQAKEYAQILDLKFAYSTNGQQIVEFDFLTGKESELGEFPSPEELWQRLTAGTVLAERQASRIALQPLDHTSTTSPRYYQSVAINRVVSAILAGQPRLLLVMATGTGKTPTALHIVWKLWQAAWRVAPGRFGKPRVLYLADRQILVDDPKDKDFAIFGDARWKIEGGNAVKSRDIYFSTYQSIAEDANRPGLYREYPRDFFDLVIIDECHRGSSRENSTWREILDWFQPAVQLGLTATPLREDSRDTYEYFGSPVYEYSLKQGIEDGFLAPYRVHRVITTFDAAGWRPTQGELDRYGQLVPDREYHTQDFEKAVSLKARTNAVARHLTEYLKRTERFAKTVVFCVDQEHAEEMRKALAGANLDLMRTHPDYVCRVTADEGDVGRAHLSHFQELDTLTPVILTTSQLLTTGVNAPTIRNVVLVRVINSMSEFKQIIGRGTRVREDYGKLFFDILDYTGSATRLFADPGFDGSAVQTTEERTTDDGEPVADSVVTVEMDPEQIERAGDPLDATADSALGPETRKYYIDGGQVAIAAHLVYELDADGHQLRVVQLTDYTAEKVRLLHRSPQELSTTWADPLRRQTLVRELQDHGVDVSHLVEIMGRPDVDPLDLLCNLAFNAPLVTRRERVQRVRALNAEFFERYGAEAREILSILLDKYALFGVDQLSIPESLKTPPIDRFGNTLEIANRFGGVDSLRNAVNALQALIYFPDSSSVRARPRRPQPVTIAGFNSTISLRREDLYDDEG